MRALLPKLARKGGSAPTHIKLFASKKLEVDLQHLLCTMQSLLHVFTCIGVMDSMSGFVACSILLPAVPWCRCTG